VSNVKSLFFAPSSFVPVITISLPFTAKVKLAREPVEGWAALTALKASTIC
jgi:hypothetical protein